MTPIEQELKDMIKQLAEKVEELEKWKEEKEKQQISLPLDESSKEIIRNI